MVTSSPLKALALTSAASASLALGSMIIAQPGFAFTVSPGPGAFTYAGGAAGPGNAVRPPNTSTTDGFSNYFQNVAGTQDYILLGAQNNQTITGSNTQGTFTATSPSYVLANPLSDASVSFNYAFLTLGAQSEVPDSLTISVINTSNGTTPYVIPLTPTTGTSFSFDFGSVAAGTYQFQISLTEQPGTPNSAAGFQNIKFNLTPIEVPVPPAFLGTILGGIIAGLRGLKKKSEASA